MFYVMFIIAKVEKHLETHIMLNLKADKLQQHNKTTFAFTNQPKP